jgi:hypothetical protein
MLAGHVVTGGCVSLTVTVNEQLDELPDGSVAVHVTVVVPTANVDPLAGTHTVVTGAQLSVTVGANVTTAPHTPVSLLCAMLAGHVITGAVVSVTVIVNVHEDEFADASVTVHVTVVTPTLNVDPDAGVQVGTPTPAQLSVTVGADHVAVAEQFPGVFEIVWLAGHVIEGA